MRVFSCLICAIATSKEAWVKDVWIASESEEKRGEGGGV